MAPIRKPKVNDYFESTDPREKEEDSLCGGVPRICQVVAIKDDTAQLKNVRTGKITPTKLARLRPGSTGWRWLDFDELPCDLTQTAPPIDPEAVEDAADAADLTEAIATETNFTPLEEVKQDLQEQGKLPAEEPAKDPQ